MQGFRVLLSHLARFVDPDGPAPEWLARITLVQGKAPVEAERRVAFAQRCRTLVAETGLDPQQSTVSQVSVPGGSFKDIPWDDEAPDEEVLPDEEWGLRDPVAVLDDSLFRGFDPLARRDLLAEQVYRASFGQLLEQVQGCLPLDPEVQE
jgi:hypothetical protein